MSCEWGPTNRMPFSPSDAVPSGVPPHAPSSPLPVSSLPRCTRMAPALSVPVTHLCFRGQGSGVLLIFVSFRAGADPACSLVARVSE